MFIDDLCTSLQFSTPSLFADDLKIFRKIEKLNDCLLLQSDIDRVHSWATKNGMVLNLTKTKYITFTRKTNWINFHYKLGNTEIPKTNIIKDLGILFDSKLFFHHHVDHLFSASIKMLGIIRSITYQFSNTDFLVLLYKVLIRPKLEYASVAWNSITTTDSNLIERIQNKFFRLCHCKSTRNMYNLDYDILVSTLNCPLP